METTLSSHPDFYASLVLNSSDLITITSDTGVYKYISNSSEAMLGYLPEEMLGKEPRHFIHPADVPGLKQSFSAAKDQPSIHLPPFRFQTKDGSWRWLDCIVRDLSADSNINGIVTHTRDITAKVEAEQRLAVSEASFSSLFYNHPDIVYTLNCEGVFENINAKATEISGFEKYEVIDRHYLSFLLPEFHAAASEAFSQALQGQSCTLEVAVRHKHVEKAWLNITAVPVIVNGTVTAVHCIAKDITEIKNAQNIIKRQAELLTSVFGSFTEGFFVLDTQWKIEYANPFFITFFGLQVQPFKGHEIWQVVPDLTASAFYNTCLQTAQTGRSTHFKVFFEARQQTLRFAVYPFSAGFSVYFEDITQKQKQEQELADLALVASKTTNSVMIINPDRSIAWVNNSFSRLTGYSPQEAIGKFPGPLLYGPDPDPEMLARIEQHFTAQLPFSQEMQNYKKNGGTIWFQTDVIPVFDEAGSLLKYVVINNDITELKEKEAEMLALTENLKRRTEDLQQFTYIVSHNLRAPVANLLGLSRLLNTENRNSEKFGRALHKLSAATNHMDMVIADLNKILSPLKNAESAVLEKVNIYSLLRDVASGLQDQLEAVNVILHNQLSPELVLQGNAAYFYSIFNNLITNAIKYRDPERKLTISVRQLTDTEPQKVTILFSDNGLGMDLEQVNNQLFQLYKRFHPGTEGRGIGLFLVKTQTEAMGGSISVTSLPGTGTTFHLIFSLQRHA